MTKNKKHSLHKYGLHPMHLHFGVWMSIGVLFITAFHASSEAVGAVFAESGYHYETGNNHTLREAREHEVHITEPSLRFARRDTVGGQ